MTQFHHFRGLADLLGSGWLQNQNLSITRDFQVPIGFLKYVSNVSEERINVLPREIVRQRVSKNGFVSAQVRTRERGRRGNCRFHNKVNEVANRGEDTRPDGLTLSRSCGNRCVRCGLAVRPRNLRAHPIANRAFDEARLGDSLIRRANPAELRCLACFRGTSQS